MEHKRLKLEDLINKAGEEKDPNSEYLEVYVKSVDATIKLKKPDNTLVIESIDLATDNSRDGDLHLVYNSIVEPNVKDSSLHNAYGVSRPVEILDEIFTLGEITNISKILTKTAGYGDDSIKLIEDIKN